MKTRLSLSLSFLLILSGCHLGLSPSDKVRHKLISQFIKKMEPFDLIALGRGGREIDGKIGSIGVTFKLHKVMSLAEAREYIVLATDCLLATVNSNPDNAKDFLEFPITAQSVDISIIGEPSPEAEDVVTNVSNMNGKILYRKADLLVSPVTSEEIQRETYEEAKLQVQNTLGDIPCSNKIDT